MLRALLLRLSTVPYWVGAGLTQANPVQPKGLFSPEAWVGPPNTRPTQRVFKALDSKGPPWVGLVHPYTPNPPTQPLVNQCGWV